MKSPFKITLCDRNWGMYLAWTEAIPEDYLTMIDIIQGDILDMNVEAFVSPANSSGHMGGGVDLAYREYFGDQIEDKVRELIEYKWNGLLPVGQADVVSTGRNRPAYLIVSPTMTGPCILTGSERDNAYKATKAALKQMKLNGIGSAAFTGMGTGVGHLPYEECAEQMARAIAEVFKPVQK